MSVLSFEDNVVRIWHTGYFLLKVKKNTEMLWFMEKKRSWSPIKNWKSLSGQRHDYTTLCLITYSFFKELRIGLSK